MVSRMPFHVRDAETDALVRELARRKGVGLTEAVKLAVRHELDTDAQKEPLRDRLRKIAEAIAKYPDTGVNTTLADLLTPLCVAKPFAAVRASLWRWSSHEFEDGLAHGREGRLRWRTVDSFFSVPLL